MVQIYEPMHLDMGSSHPLTDAIKKEVHDHKLNFSVLVCGRFQMRKSTTSVGLALNLDKTFSFDEDFAIISTKDMLNAVSKGSGRGKVKLLDEVGTGMDHHKWQDFFQRAMSYVLQTMGVEGKIIIVTVPYQDLVNSDILKFFNMRIRMIGKNDSARYAIGEVVTLQYNEDTGILYKKQPIGDYPDGVSMPIKTLKFRYPPPEVLDRYFAISNAQKKGLQYDLLAEANKIEVEASKSSFSSEKYVDEIVGNPREFVKTYTGRTFVDANYIMSKWGFGRQRACNIKAAAERKIDFAALQKGNQQVGQPG